MNLTEEDIITEHFGGAYEGFRSPIKVIPQIFLVFVLARSASHTAHVKSRWLSPYISITCGDATWT